ncbi:MAG: xanthine dehydrogenase family protein molybdopterin-binding subunit [Sediminicola sp.]|tara:strand:+ start:61842 stop:64079 length:2238 start_codon:yes stop_codon:yes gene_type:complete
MSEDIQIGKPISRLEGREKVTGEAKYAGDYQVPDLLHGYIVNATVTKGKILEIDETMARDVPGVITIFSHKNRPKLPWFNLMYTDMDAPPGNPFKPLYDGKIKYHGQPIALVVAETFETARYAASLMKVSYSEESFETDLLTAKWRRRKPKKGMASLMKPAPPKPKGNFELAYAQADAQASGEFVHGTEHHNPLELFATTTVFEGSGKLTVYDKTQGTNNCQVYIANVFGLHYKDVRIVSPFVGGAFGSGLRPQYQLFLCVMASLELKRNVRVTMDRKQMFTFGHRPQTLQNTRFGASSDGKVTAIKHTAVGETSRYEDYTEIVVNWANMLYPSKNTMLEHDLVPLDVHTPVDMRAPGGSTGLHAIEATMDALSYRLKMDPVQFRLINYADRDDSADRPFSSKELKQCYLQGAERFGWDTRNSQPRSTKKGNRLVGSGMSSGIWDVMALPARAEAQLVEGGKVIIKSAVTDIGTGTLTVMSQIAADEMGLEMEDISFEYGDSKFPLSPIQGGSYTTGVIGSAVQTACRSLKKKILVRARNMEDSLFSRSQLKDVIFRNGKIYLLADETVSISFKKIMEHHGSPSIKTTQSNLPNFGKLKKYTRAAHSATFVEVEVDEQLGTIYVTRALTAVAAGKIINSKTARSQILGGMVWGIGKALREETLMDHRLGKYINQNLAEYHIPVHADIGEMEVMFIEEKDEIVNDLGIKGVGEIGLASMAPAIANAIYHATGKRMNKFPIHFNELL